MLLVTGNEKICPVSDGTLQYSVVRVIGEDARKPFRWSDEQSDSIHLRQRLSDLKLTPIEGF